MSESPNQRNCQSDKPLVPKKLSQYGMACWLLIGIGMVGLAVIFLISKISLVFISLFLALTLTAIFRPLTRVLDVVLPRALATAISMVVLFSVSGGLVYYIVWSITSSWDELTASFTKGAHNILNMLEDGSLPVKMSREEVTSGIKNAINTGVAGLKDNWGGLANQVFSNAGIFVSFITVALTTIFMTVFFVHSGDKMWLWFLNLLPKVRRHKTHKIALAGWHTFAGYVRGTFIVSAADGVAAFVLMLVAGVPLAGPLATLVLFGSFVPLIGIPVAMVIAALVALTTKGVSAALIVLIGLIVISQLEANLLRPVVMGKQVEVHPVLVGAGVIAGTMLAGIFGAIIAIPAMAVVWAIYKTLNQPEDPLEELPSVDVEASLGVKNDD